jgi:hypothetical protein
VSFGGEFWFVVELSTRRPVVKYGPPGGDGGGEPPSRGSELRGWGTTRKKPKKTEEERKRNSSSRCGLGMTVFSEGRFENPKRYYGAWGVRPNYVHAISFL